MSKIFTGTQLNSVNLHFSVNKFISKYTTEKHQKYEDDEDLTLKSIKRW